MRGSPLSQGLDLRVFLGGFLGGFLSYYVQSKASLLSTEERRGRK